MSNFTIQRECKYCVGGALTCEHCGGTSVNKFFDIVPPTNVFYSHEILECLDPTEHNALTDAQKEGVLTILSCGMVDMNVGKVGRTRLLNWFGAGSTTVANLTAILV